MHDRQSAIAEVSQHCDLQERLHVAPASAQGRGVFFEPITRALNQTGRLHEYQRLMPGSHSAMRLYPLGDLLERLAVAGAILSGPAPSTTACSKSAA